MGILKRSVADFLCTFAAFTIILVCIALVANKDFSDGVFVLDEKTGCVEIFGTKIELRQEVFEMFDDLVGFNDNVFGRGFSDMLRKIVKFTLSYVGDFLKIAFETAQMVVGTA